MCRAEGVQIRRLRSPVDVGWEHALPTGHAAVLMGLSFAGTGSFGRVKLVRHKATKNVYAMKMLSKALVLRTKQSDHIIAEKEILNNIMHPFIVNL